MRDFGRWTTRMRATMAVLAIALCTIASAVTAMAQPATPSSGSTSFADAFKALSQPSSSGLAAFADTFKTPDQNWGADNAYSAVTDGKFRFDVPAKQHAERYTGRYPSTALNLQVDVAAGPQTGGSTSAGLVFWANGKGSVETLFLIDPIGGRFAISGVFAGAITPEVPWKSTPGLHIGKTNHLQVVANEDEVDFLINGQIVDSGPGYDSTSGRLIGLYAAGSDSGSGDYAFSNFSAGPWVALPSNTPRAQSAVADVWKYISGPDSKGPTAAEMIPSISGPQLASGDPGQILFTDDFKTLDPDWGAGDADSAVTDGHMEFTVPTGLEAARYSGKYTFDQFDVAVSVAAAPETKINGAAGLVFWIDNSGNSTTFIIDPIAGSFAINGVTSAKTTPIVDWTANPAINTTPGASNLLEIVADEKHAAFLINGHPAADIATPQQAAGTFIGLLADGADTGPGDYAFSNFSVKVPAGGSLPPGIVAAPAAAPGKPIFADDFSTLDSSWGYVNPTLKVADGQLQIVAPANSAFDILNDKYSYGPADIGTDLIEAAGGDANGFGGLLFWASDTGDYTLFGIAPTDGGFFASRLAGGKSTTLIDTQASDAIKTAAGAVNHLEVAVRADKAYLIINGQQVGEVPAPSASAGGLVGVHGESGDKLASTLGFSAFSVVEPNGSGPPAGISAALPPGEANFTDDFASLDPGWGKATKQIYTANGRLEVHSQPKYEVDAYTTAHAVATDDVAATMVAESGTPSDANGGLLFWMKDPDNYTDFAVDPLSSRFAVFGEAGGKSTTLLDWTDTTLIDLGTDKANRLGVALRADKAILMLNGHQVAEIPAPQTPAGSFIGFDSYAGQQAPGNFGFSHLVVTPPASGELPPGTAQAPTVAAGQTIFSDEFNSFDPSWGISNATGYVANGRLELRSGPNQEIDEINDKYAYGDVDVEVSAVEEAGTDSGPLAGLLFWAADAGDYTLFGVDPLSGKFAAFRQVGDKSTTLLDWTASPAIVTGIGKSNRLGISLQSDKAVLLINGQQVGEVPKPATVPGSLVGLYGGGDKPPGSFGYADFSVTAPADANGAAAVSAPTSATPPPPAIAAMSSPASASPAPAQPSTPGATPPAPSALPSPQPSSEAPVTADAGTPPPAIPAPAVASGGVPLVPFNPSAAPAVPGAPATDIAPPAPWKPGPDETLVFSDDFQSYGPSWGKPDNQVFVQNGRLVAQLPGFGFGTRLNGAYRYYDADISFAGRVVSGPEQSGIELIFWFADNQHYDYLHIDAAGRFQVHNFSGSTVTDIVPLQMSPAIKTGVGQWNTIQLSMRGGAATLLINGVSVAQFAGAPPPHGGAIGLVGIGAGPGPSTLEFANLRIAVPAPVRLTRGWSAIEAQAPMTAPPGATLADDFNTLDPDWGLPVGLVTVAGDKLVEEAQNANAAGVASQKYLFDDADLGVGLALTETAQPDTVGSLFFWGSANLSDTYLLSISPLGYFRLGHDVRSSDTDIIKWRGTAALRQGVGQLNQIRLTLRGGQGSVVINGQTVAQFVATPPPGGGLVGLGMLASKAGTSTWEFSKLHATEAAPPPSQ